jgi:hypothetical protein
MASKVKEIEMFYSIKRLPEAQSEEKHGVWDPMPELTITSPYVHSRVDSQYIYLYH